MIKDARLQPRHPIRVVAKRTGLTTAVLRAWERRYDAVTPTRSDGGQRLYTDYDVTRLSLLRQAVEGGRSIGSVAGLSDTSLEQLVLEDVGAISRPDPGLERARSEEEHSSLIECLDAVTSLDHVGLERALMSAAVRLPHDELIDEVVEPLLVRIGAMWRDELIRPGAEHLATSTIRRFLEWLLSWVSGDGSRGTMIAATPQGQVHEFGALMSCVVAAAEGWSAIFLGPDLPAAEIAIVAERVDANAVALSAIIPGAEPDAVEQILDLRKLLPAGVHLFTGGSALVSSATELERNGVRLLSSLRELRAAFIANGL